MVCDRFFVLMKTFSDIPVIPETATPEAEDAWTKRCYESAKGLLINEMQDSWFFGSTNPENVRGRFLLFAGGVPLYREIFADVAAKGYEGFELR